MRVLMTVAVVRLPATLYQHDRLAGRSLKTRKSAPGPGTEAQEAASHIQFSAGYPTTTAVVIGLRNEFYRQI